ncbi:MAG: transcriptional repressor [Chloroflexota bacterium]|nr:transcriptional repressor [Chloroflexota bacterium]
MAEAVTMEKAVGALQKHGYRITPQRTMILESLLGASDHVTAEGLYEDVRKSYPHISFSTVYRTLELLRDSGLITQTDLGGGRWQYHPADKADHHHLICQRCGAVSTVPQEIFHDVHTHLQKKYGFDALMTHYAVYGRCAKCRGDGDDSGTGESE